MQASPVGGHEYQGDVQTHRRLIRTDARSLIGGVLMGIFMVLVVGLCDRIDASLSGGAFPILGGTAWAITMGLSALLFGLPGAVIAGITQALMDMALGVPLAPAFLVANTVGPVVFALVAYRLPMVKWSHYFLALLPSVVLGNLVVAIFLVSALKVPMQAVALASTVVAVVSIAVSTFAVRAAAVAVWRSRILDR